MENGPVLRDIHVPAVSWWPPAPGWWLLAVLIVALIVVTALLWRRARRGRRAIAAARRELEALATAHVADGDDIALAAGLSRLLRRAALAMEPAAAASNGDAWRAFLQRRAPRAYTCEQLEILSDAPYRRQLSLHGAALLSATRAWCDHALYGIDNSGASMRNRFPRVHGNIARVRRVFELRAARPGRRPTGSQP